MSFTFGSFKSLCSQVAMPLCPLVEGKTEPLCYSRNIDLGGMMIFEPATLVIHVIALIMTGIMLYHIKSKYTAIGRKEIALFFYLYSLLVVLEMLLVTGIIPIADTSYIYFTAIYMGIVVAMVGCLVMNGFVGFQWAEDGTSASMWSLRGVSFLLFVVTLVIALATFQGFMGLGPQSTMPLFIVYLVVPSVCLIVYVISQVMLVVNTLDDQWPLGDILFGVLFFIAGQICLYAFSTGLCEVTSHYVDGLFFGTICNLLSVMMVYKYWDSITKEDLEFSVGTKAQTWEVKNPLLQDDSIRKSQYR